VVRPGGPAAAAGLLVGDEILTVDGHDVTGGNSPLHMLLRGVPEGTVLRLGLARGVTVEITARRRM
jgi:C-terminal processing protease CtpA/Prc